MKLTRPANLRLSLNSLYRNQTPARTTTDPALVSTEYSRVSIASENIFEGHVTRTRRVFRCSPEDVLLQRRGCKLPFNFRVFTPRPRPDGEKDNGFRMEKTTDRHLGEWVVHCPALAKPTAKASSMPQLLRICTRQPINKDASDSSTLLVCLAPPPSPCGKDEELSRKIVLVVCGTGRRNFHVDPRLPIWP